VRWIARRLEEAGHDTWAVGGAVRDVLLGRASGDWDLTTHARPEEVRRLFRRTVPLGVEHGTVGVLKDDTLYEVTTFRRDVETDGRHAVVAFAETIEEDLARRDFTINAVAWHPLREELRDPFGGLADMERRVLRTVGGAEDRFREDYLRILRALRFAGLFGLEIERETWASLCALVGHLTVLSAERVRDELVKVLDADPAPARALGLYAESGALAVLYPELEALRLSPSPAASPSVASPSPSAASAAAPDAWALALHAAEALPRGRPLLRLAGLLRALAPADVAALLLRLRFSNAQVDETAYRAGGPPLPEASARDAAFRCWLSANGPGRLAALARLDLARAQAELRLGLPDRTGSVVASWRKAREVRAADPPLAVGDLAIDGRALISLGLKPGPHFGRILDQLLGWVLEDPARNRRELLAERVLELAARESHHG
jgi:tRNA nucleotidyltransferase (CCA-adding enzyme)